MEVLWLCLDSSFLGKYTPSPPGGGKKLENINKKKKKYWELEGKQKLKDFRTSLCITAAVVISFSVFIAL